MELGRKFDGGRAWRLWNGPHLADVVPGSVVFYDDPDLGRADEVTWYAGVEVHKLVLVIALYGRAGDKRVLGPIFEDDTTPEGLVRLGKQVGPFCPARFLMENSGVYHVPVY